MLEIFAGKCIDIWRNLISTTSVLQQCQSLRHRSIFLSIKKLALFVLRATLLQKNRLLAEVTCSIIEVSGLQKRRIWLLIGSFCFDAKLSDYFYKPFTLFSSETFFTNLIVFEFLINVSKWTKKTLQIDNAWICGNRL